MTEHSHRDLSKDPANLKIATLIGTRMAIQELVPDHNTFKLIEEEVLSLARKEGLGIGKFEEPDVICEVQKDLSHFTLTYTFHEINTPEAENLREERRKLRERIEKRLAEYKLKHPEVKFPLIQNTGPIPEPETLFE
jgi:hypothetical protein